jgi:PRC-barrel domain
MENSVNTSSTPHEDVSPQPGFRGHDVVDPNHRLIGTISDVVYDSGGDPQWAIVDLGLLRSSHYVPIPAGYMSESGEFVVPYDKKVVKAAPKADRSHLVDSITRSELHRHYELH